MSYLLDANIFIQAKSLHYGFDFCPAFWDWLIEQNQKGTVFSIEKVKDEINAKEDELSQWANKLGDGFFLELDTAEAVFREVSQWVYNQSYANGAINDFLNVADYYLVCHALGHGLTIVTEEVSHNSKKRVKIPDACTGLGIKCMLTHQMLRHERAKFVLEE